MSLHCGEHIDQLKPGHLIQEVGVHSQVLHVKDANLCFCWNDQKFEIFLPSDVKSLPSLLIRWRLLGFTMIGGWLGNTHRRLRMSKSWLLVSIGDHSKQDCCITQLKWLFRPSQSYNLPPWSLAFWQRHFLFSLYWYNLRIRLQDISLHSPIGPWLVEWKTKWMNSSWFTDSSRVTLASKSCVRLSRAKTK